MNGIKILYQNRNGELLSDGFQPLLCDGGTVLKYESTRYINVPSDLKNNNLPELYIHKELCCGCSACLIACPKSKLETDDYISYRFLKTSDRLESFPYTGAISMLPDEEGFMYPVVDANKCVRCYKCLKVYPYKGE